jgi:hypothetical protein
MKKFFALTLAVTMVASLLPAAAFASAGGNKGELNLNGPHFELNLLGKPDGWNDKEVTNPDRHTMFVPQDTTNWEIELKTGTNGNKLANHGIVTDNVDTLPGFAIYMTQGTEFAVVDGSAFDGDACEFQLGPGKYQVFVAARAKPTENAPTIDGWLQAYDIDGQLYYYLNLGTVSFTRQWKNATDLFYIDSGETANTPLPAPSDPTWIFDYIANLDTSEWGDLAYFWQLQNYGTKLIKVRFFPVAG